MDKINTTTNKIRLLHLVHGLGIGGAEIALFHYIKALGKEDYEHYVYCIGNRGPVKEKIESLGIPVKMGKTKASIKHPFKFLVSSISLMRGLVRFIKKNRIQIIQSHSGFANQVGVAAGKFSKLPVFPTVHSTMAFKYSRNNWDLRVYLNRAVNTYIYRAAFRVLAVSQEVKKTVKKTYGVKDSKLLVLKNGIVFNDSSLKAADLTKEFGLSGDEFKIIAVGRLVSLKCFHILVNAIAEIVNFGLRDVLVLIAGEGEERPQLERLVKNLGLENYVKFLGSRHDVLELMKASDVFILPSRYEGLSIAMIEAMACGLPIIASDGPGLRDHIDHEKNGLLFPVNNHIFLADNIIRLVNDEKLRVRLSHQSRQCFTRDYNMRNNIKLLDTLFKKYCKPN